jgi:hypothetical protein
MAVVEILKATDTTSPFHVSSRKPTSTLLMGTGLAALAAAGRRCAQTQ